MMLALIGAIIALLLLRRWHDRQLENVESDVIPSDAREAKFNS